MGQDVQCFIVNLSTKHCRDSLFEVNVVLTVWISLIYTQPGAFYDWNLTGSLILHLSLCCNWRKTASNLSSLNNFLLGVLKGCCYLSLNLSCDFVFYNIVSVPLCYSESVSSVGATFQGKRKTLNIKLQFLAPSKLLLKNDTWLWHSWANGTKTKVKAAVSGSLSKISPFQLHVSKLNKHFKYKARRSCKAMWVNDMYHSSVLPKDTKKAQH